MPTYLTQADYAAHLGRTPSWVTQLKQAGRLVMSPDGKKVDVEASDAKIAGTELLDNPGVAQRWQEHREQTGTAQAAPPAAPAPADDVAAESLKKSKAVKAHFDALAAKVAYEQTVGDLVPAADARAVAVEIATAFRVGLERLDSIAPELAAATDEQRVLGLLAGVREEILSGLASQLERASHNLGTKEPR